MLILLPDKEAITRFGNFRKISILEIPFPYKLMLDISFKEDAFVDCNKKASFKTKTLIQYFVTFIYVIMQEIETILQRIEGNKSVIGTLVLDSKQKIIHSAFKGIDPAKYAERLPKLIERASSLVKDIDHTNELTFLRIRTDKIELMVSPSQDYTLIIIQNVVLIDS